MSAFFFTRSCERWKGLRHVFFGPCRPGRTWGTRPGKKASCFATALVLCLCLIAGGARGQTDTNRRKLIIDQDSFGPGGSNLQAILLALQAPNVEVLGITVESGDGWRDENVAHLLRMLELIGRTDVGVYPGVSYPLVNSAAATKRREGMYGKLAYKGAWTEEWAKYNNIDRTAYHDAHVIPPLREGTPKAQPAKESAVSFLIRSVHEFPGQVTIMALGPETNLALAASLDENFAASAKELFLEGGSFNPIAVAGDPFAVQFVNTPRSNFNFLWDPEAARIVLHASWKHITVVPTDATTNTKLTEALVQRATKISGKPQTPVQEYVNAYGERNFPMWDEAAFAAWLEPSLIIEHDSLAMDVDSGSGGAGYGHTLSWQMGKGPGIGEPDVEVIRRIDALSFEKLFVKLMAK